MRRRRPRARMRADRAGVVGRDAEVGDLDRQRAQQGAQDRAVGVVDAAGTVGAAGLDAARRRSRGAPREAARTPAARPGPARRRGRSPAGAGGCRARAPTGPARTSSPARRRLAPALQAARDGHGAVLGARPPPAAPRCRRPPASPHRSARAGRRLAGSAPAKGWPAAARPGSQRQPRARPRACRAAKAKAKPSTAALSKAGTSRGLTSGCGEAAAGGVGQRRLLDADDRGDPLAQQGMGGADARSGRRHRRSSRWASAAHAGARDRRGGRGRSAAIAGDVVEAELGQVRAREAARRWRGRRSVGSSSARSGVPRSRRCTSSLGCGKRLKPSTMTRSTGRHPRRAARPGGGSGAPRSSWITAQRRAVASTTSSAPASRWRQVSLPGWSRSTSWWACLTVETR